MMEKSTLEFETNQHIIGIILAHYFPDLLQTW